MADETNTEVLEHPTEPVVEGPTETTTEAPIVETTTEDATKKPPKKTDPVVGELTKERGRRRELEARLAAAEKAAQAAQELAARLSKGDKADTAPAPAQVDPAEMQRMVRAEAERMRFLEKVEEVRSRGSEHFGSDGFQTAIQALQAYGADDDAVVRNVLEVDPANAHLLLHQISQDAARAIGLVNMTPTQRVAELTRMSIEAKKPAAKVEEVKPAAKAISAAPKPAPAISSSTSKVVNGWSDEASDEEFDKQFQKHLERKRSRR